MSRVNSITRFVPHATLFSVVALLCAMVPGLAMAQAAGESAKTLGDMTNNFYYSLVNLQTFLSLFSYILGVYFSITGLMHIRNHVDDPGRNPLNKALLRLAAAAFFIFSPVFASMLIGSISGDTGATAMLKFSQNSGVTVGEAGGDGLDAMLVRFVMNFAGPFLDNLLPFIAYAAGVVLMLIGLKRLALADGNGPQAPGGLGTMGTFFVAAALMSFGYIVYTIEGSLFGTDTITNSPIFMNDAKSGSAALNDQANRVMWGVFIFLRIVGYISVLRGLFMLRGISEGQNVTMMAVSTHMVAGAMLINGTAFVIAVQNTFIDPANHILK